MSNGKQILLNGRPVTEEELRKKQEEIKSQRGVQLVEVAPNTFKTLIKG